jgi:hypothetical protein
MRNEVSKKIQFRRLPYWYYRWNLFMMYTVEMSSGGHHMTIVSGIRTILRALPHSLSDGNVCITNERDL